ncbi:hydroxymethylglutaryl-CoA lyase [Candidatus Acetothermia bacterium]|nr:hydroxymethylglutaryl-CoA lyase [Candidatus Acetothermia bacterium]
MRINLADKPIYLTEVGPRDGLQNEKEIIPTEVKVAFVNALSRTGVSEIEVSSFVSPKKIPQLADSSEVFQKIERVPGIIYSALVPNAQGFERALEAKVNKIAVFTAASETFNQKNINATIAESIERFKPVVARAKQEKLPVRGYISTCFHCPYEGKIAPSAVIPIVQQLLALGVDEIVLSDTIGKAVPTEVRTLLDAVLKQLSQERVTLHFHDTYGTGIANVLAGWEYGISRFDASAGGLGGCPYAPGASGNVATEDVVYALQNSGAKLSVDLNQVIAASQRIAAHLQKPLPSRVYGAYRSKN